jgi:hypothetical protein
MSLISPNSKRIPDKFEMAEKMGRVSIFTAPSNSTLPPPPKPLTLD